MYLTLYYQQWLKSLRGGFLRQGWGVKIFMGLLFLYFGGAFALMGYFTKEILAGIYEDEAVLTPVFMGLVLYYLLVDLVTRFFLQDLKVLNIRQYLCLPIARARLIHFLLGGSVFNFFNLFALFFILPWALRVVAVEYSGLSALLWSLSMVALVLNNHFLAIYLKRMVAVKMKIFVGAALVVAGIFIANYLEWFSLSEFSRALLSPLASQAWWGLVPILLLVLSYRLNFHFLRQHSYLDRWATKGSEARGQNFSYLESRGTLGLMLATELKLILRHKRTKNALMLSVFFLFYGLIFYNSDIYADSFSWLLFVGIFTTGIFMINYGQFLVSWESSYFDGILTRAYPMQDYYRAKYLLLVLSALPLYLLSLPYVYYGIHAFYINTAALLYNVGINSVVLLYASTYNKKPIDLSRGSAFNYQGTSAVQFLITIPLLLVPLGIFQAFQVFDQPYWGLVFLASLGLLGLLFHRYFIRETLLNFQEKKYRNAAGYRQRD